MKAFTKSRASTIFDICNYILMGIALVIFLYPFWDTMVLSFSTPLKATQLGLRIFPAPLSLGAYQTVFRSNAIYIGYVNTIFRTVIGTAIHVLITYCGAYVISKRNLPLRTPITFLILFTMFFNGGLIATYLNIKSLGLLGLRWALILPLTTSAWTLVIARNFIMAIPDDLEDAAVIDGAHPLVLIFRIMMPISKPILAVLALWMAVTHWNSWFDALIYITDEKKMVLQLLLRKILIEQTEAMMENLTLSTTQTTPETVKAATVMVAIGPIILMYPFLQKYFVKGILIGSLKG
jgi:putative aldouronate transport system permease protein